LQTGALTGNPVIVKQLLEARAEVDRADFAGMTPLVMIAGMSASDLMGFLQEAEEVATLLLAHKADPRHKTVDGDTPLSLAEENDNHTILELLQGEEERAIAQERDTSLMVAVRAGNVDDVLQLCQQPEIQADKDVRDVNGKTALFHAVELGSTEIVRALLAEGVNIELPEREGVTPVHSAARTGFLDICVALCKARADVNAWDSQQRAPLLSAAAGGFVGVAKVLVDARADVAAVSNNGMGALHHAASGGHQQVVKFLIEEKANPNLRDGKGCTPLQLFPHAHRSTFVEAMLTAQAQVGTPAAG
jgi:ankyrin repeat protein